MRSTYLDQLRGLAVVAMIIFHTAYDLRTLQFIDWDFSTGFWYVFPRGIAFSFLFCVGISLNYTHVPKIKWKSLGERSLKLGAAAFIISLGTYIMFPAQWIYFGTLHCILIGSLFGALLVNHRKLALGLLILILIAQYGLDYDIQWVSSILKRPSMDFIPIYPWFWAILLGMLLGPYLSKNQHLQRMRSLPFLTLLGRHSLKIYLLHQPLIFGSLMLLKTILKP